MSSNLLWRAGEGGLKIMLCEAVPTILSTQEREKKKKKSQQQLDPVMMMERVDGLFLREQRLIFK